MNHSAFPIHSFSSEADMYVCQHCGVKNRIPDPLRRGMSGLIGKWNCGRCKTLILYRRTTFNEMWLRECRREIELLVKEAYEIQPSIFSAGSVTLLITKLNRAQTKYRNWESNIESISARDLRVEILKSYEPDINQIYKNFEKLSCVVQNNDRLGRYLEKYGRVRSFLNGVAGIISVVADILTLIGIPNGLHGLAEKLHQKLLK